MGKVLNGFTPDTAKNLQLDAGILVLGLEKPEEFTGEIKTPARSIGATSGGAKFSATPEIRNIFEDLDGSRGSYMSGNVIDNWEITLTATIKEMTAENLRLSLGASDVTKATEDGKYDKITGRVEVKDGDYLKNICWLGTINGSDEPIIIELKNVLNTAGMSFTASDKATGGVDLELKAHFDLINPTEVPFVIYTPKAVATP